MPGLKIGEVVDRDLVAILQSGGRNQFECVDVVRLPASVDV